jgi:AraC family transcriptional regulator of adaptative response/methylated-DNA-[protein]-cysteine methyltransferase
MKQQRSSTNSKKVNGDDGAETIRFAVGECPLGLVLMAASEKGVCALFMGDEAELLVEDLRVRFPDAQFIESERDLEPVMAKVTRLFEMPGIDLDLPLDARGTDFQQKVWRALRQIPAGSTTSYTEIAKRIGLPKAVRAVAQACAANPVALVIPCHRVVRSDGGLSGFRWGVERKRALLERESRVPVKKDQDRDSRRVFLSQSSAS